MDLCPTSTCSFLDFAATGRYFVLIIRTSSFSTRVTCGSDTSLDCFADYINHFEASPEKCLCPNTYGVHINQLLQPQDTGLDKVA